MAKFNAADWYRDECEEHVVRLDVGGYKVTLEGFAEDTSEAWAALAATQGDKLKVTSPKTAADGIKAKKAAKGKPAKVVKLITRYAEAHRGGETEEDTPLPKDRGGVDKAIIGGNGKGK